MTDYETLARELKAISEGVKKETTILSNASALIYDSMDGLNWCGFYLLEDGVLYLGPFQGKVACTEIEVGKGVCGTAIARGETVLVRDVHEFAGHIACDSASNSEIVVPMRKNGVLYGVLDIDSPELSRFDEIDQKGLEQAVRAIERFL